jgi:transcriptional regulator with XRE-family HTH domain
MKSSLLQRVMQVREFYGLNELQMSKRLQIPQTTLNGYFKLKRKPSIDIVMAILNEFEDISAEWLLRGTGQMLATDNLPPITGTETDDAMTLHAELARTTARLEELTAENAKLLHQLDFMETLNYKITGRCHALEKQLADAGIASSEKVS